MKKFTSILLVFAIISSCFAFMGCINLNDDITMKEAYLRQFGIKDVKAEDVVIDYDAGTYNGARVIMLDAEWHDPEKWVEQLGGYSITYYDSNRLYVYKNGIFLTLSDAYSRQKISEKEICKIVDKFANDVKYYHNTCDQYDFNIELPDEDFSSNDINYGINIAFDQELFALTKTYQEKDNIVLDYVGTNIINKIEGVYEGRFRVVAIRFHHDNPIYLSYVIELLNQLPGVVYIEPFNPNFHGYAQA